MSHRTKQGAVVVLTVLASACGAEPPAAAMVPVLRVEPASVRADVGVPVLLAASLSPAAPGTSVRWVSSDAQIVRLDTVVPFGHPVVGRGVAAGSTTVMVRTMGTAPSAEVVMPVSVVCVTLASGPVVTPVTAAIAVGDTLRFRAAVFTGCPTAPEPLVWSTVDTAVASIDASGLVTGRRPGVATLVVRALRLAGVSAAATLTVRAPTR